MTGKQSEPTLPSRYNWKDHVGSKYQKRHYEDVARLLHGAVEHAEHEQRFVDVLLVDEFADLFAADNPLFDRERFLRACGLGSA